MAALMSYHVAASVETKLVALLSERESVAQCQSAYSAITKLFCKGNLRV